MVSGRGFGVAKQTLLLAFSNFGGPRFVATLKRRARKLLLRYRINFGWGPQVHPRLSNVYFANTGVGTDGMKLITWGLL